MLTEKEHESTKSQREKKYSRTSIMAACLITAFITPFMSSALNLSVPTLEKAFDINATTVSWVVSAYTISITMFSLLMGKIADNRGHNTLFRMGIAGFGIASFLCIMSPNVYLLVALRFLQGVFAAMMFATNNSILVRSYPPEMKGKVLGYSISATYIGLTTGPVLGGFLDNTLGWESVFFCAMIASIVAYAASVQAARAQEQLGIEEITGSSKPDVPGTIIYFGAVFLSLFGMTEWTVLSCGKYLFLLGTLCFVLFFLFESKRTDPLVRVTLFTESRAFTFSSLAALLNYAATFAVSYIMSIYLQVVMGLPSATAGIILIATPACQALFSPMMGSLSDRKSPSVLASIGMGISGVGLLLYAGITEHTPLGLLILLMCVMGFGFAMFSSPNMNAILSCVNEEEYGVANSIIATMRTYGQSTGMAVLNVVTGLFLGSSSLDLAPKEQLMTVVHASFLMFALLCGVGLIFSLIRNRK